VLPVASILSVGYGLAGTVGIAQACRRPRVLDVQVRCVRPVLQVAQAFFGQVAGLTRPVLPEDDAGELQAQVRQEGPVVDRGHVGPARPDQFLSGLRVAKARSGDGHQIAEAAEEKVQIGLVCGP
jgi:hypothetical protein